MSEAGIASAMAGERAELALIDGPKSAWTMRGDCRYATLPLIRRWLVDGALVIVDDAHRRRERDIIERWTTERLFEPLRSYAVGGGLNVGRVSGFTHQRSVIEPNAKLGNCESLPVLRGATISKP